MRASWNFQDVDPLKQNIAASSPLFLSISLSLPLFFRNVQFVSSFFSTSVFFANSFCAKPTWAYVITYTVFNLFSINKLLQHLKLEKYWQEQTRLFLFVRAKGVLIAQRKK